MSELPTDDFLRVCALNANLERTTADPQRRRALAGLLEATAKLVPSGPGRLLAELPRAIGERMAAYGWLWNGFYVASDPGARSLRLGPAWGPPVCAELERSGGPLTSGMCFDALLLNQTLAAYDASDWPGYVSCDAESGLATVSGIVCPLRDAGGAPVAVWDLDATQTIDPADVRTMDVLFATLSRVLDLEPEHFFQAR